MPTTGGEPSSYAPDGMHRLPFDGYMPPVEQTARFCQMSWENPFVVHGAHRLSASDLAAMAREYRRRLERLRSELETAT